MSFGKENFLRTKFVGYLQRLDPAAHARWGKMNVQQMVEHLAESLQIANGRLTLEPVATTAEHLRRLRDFLLSDKPFRENTRNPTLPEDPVPIRFQTLQAAIGALQEELIYFFEAFGKDHTLTTRNPIFGELDFEQNVRLLYKHALHHLRQFGVEPLGV